MRLLKDTRTNHPLGGDEQLHVTHCTQRTSLLLHTGHRKIAKRLILPTAEAGVGEIARSMNACVSYARYVTMKHQTEPAANSSRTLFAAKASS